MDFTITSSSFDVWWLQKPHRGMNVAVIGRVNKHSPQTCLALSLTALILYFPANLFPIMSYELYGNRTSTTVWQGVVSLMDQGSYFVAGVVFLASILIPFIKLIILFYLSFSAGNPVHHEFKVKMHSFVEAIGRWSMLDIFLLAIIVSLVKLGHWATVEPEVGSLFFVLVVIFTMCASWAFDPEFAT